VLNVALTLVASDETTATMATTMSPSITAYSTAVGPSSLATKFRNERNSFLTLGLLFVIGRHVDAKPFWRR
jgi:hypothetical protein